AGMAIRRASKAQLRALFTPEQQRKFDATSGEDSGVRAEVESLVRTSPAIAARLGSLTRVSPTGATTTTSLINEQVLALKGSSTFLLRGSSGAETVKVFWEKSPPSAPARIVRLETAQGESFGP